MSEEITNNDLQFDLPKNQSSVIKVLGVGGGGSNAVNYMKSLGIKDVNYVICNTDSQALDNSSVENRIQLGANLTEGLGAGANPEIGKEAAIESLEQIDTILASNTKMLFVTAGMGGGTGTGAAPIIAKHSQEMGLLTVGIVTMPFSFEGKGRMKQAEKGLKELRKYVDSLIIIKNDKLREVYGNLGFKKGFQKADIILATAVKAIAEVITHHYNTNIDLKDAKTVLANSGTAIMGSATAGGDDRAIECIKSALDSPLLNDNNITGAKNVLLLIISGSEDHEITVDEIGIINEHIQNEAGGNTNIILGIGEDESLEDKVSVTIIATGFEGGQIIDLAPEKPNTIRIPLDAEIKEPEVKKPKKINPITDKISSEKKSLESTESKLKQVDLFAAVKEAEAEAEIEQKGTVDENITEEINTPVEESNDEIQAVDFPADLNDNEVVFEVTRTPLIDDSEIEEAEMHESPHSDSFQVESENIESNFEIKEQEEELTIVDETEELEGEIVMQSEPSIELEDTNEVESTFEIEELDEELTIVEESEELENKEESLPSFETEEQNEELKIVNETEELEVETSFEFESSINIDDTEEESSFVLMDETEESIEFNSTKDREEKDNYEDVIESQPTTEAEPQISESTFESFGLDLDEFTIVNEESDTETIESSKEEKKEIILDPINFSIEEMNQASDNKIDLENTKKEDLIKDEDSTSYSNLEEEPTTSHSLNDLIDLEEKLGMRKPQPSEQHVDLAPDKVQNDGFEIKQISEDELKIRDESANPVDNSIAEAKKRKSLERIARLKEYNFQFKNQEETLNEPAYKRAGISVQNNGLSEEKNLSRMSVENKDDNVQINTNNSFLHDNVD